MQNVSNGPFVYGSVLRCPDSHINFLKSYLILRSDFIISDNDPTEFYWSNYLRVGCKGVRLKLFHCIGSLL